MMYLNKDKYLELKQKFVMLELTKLNASLVTKETPIEFDDIKNGILSTIKSIDNEYTFPYSLMNVERTYIDFAEISDEIRRALEDHDNPEVVKIRKLGMSQDSLNEIIFERPIFNIFIDKFWGNVEHNNYYTINKFKVGGLVTVVGMLINRLKQITTSKDAHILSETLLMVNFLELIEGLLAFSNDYHGEKDGTI